MRGLWAEQLARIGNSKLRNAQQNVRQSLSPYQIVGLFVPSTLLCRFVRLADTLFSVKIFTVRLRHLFP